MKNQEIAEKLLKLLLGINYLKWDIETRELYLVFPKHILLTKNDDITSKFLNVNFKNITSKNDITDFISSCIFWKQSRTKFLHILNKLKYVKYESFFKNVPIEIHNFIDPIEYTVDYFDIDSEYDAFLKKPIN